MGNLKWAVVGTGYIAGNFSESMALVPGAVKTAVVGSSAEKARAFADKHGFSGAYADFAQMVAAEKPDAVYIAVPNHRHAQFVMAALDAGVHVLCEKPAADNAAQLRWMIDKARQKDLFFMEGMWTRCFPAVQQAKRWIENGVIGEVVSVHAGFGIKALEEGWQPWKRSAASCAGAIRDVGVYTLGYAFLAFGKKPESITSSVRLVGGTDMHEELLLQYPNGATALLTSSFLMRSEHHAMIYGTRGAIRVGPRLWCPDSAVLTRYSETDVFEENVVERFHEPYAAHGFQYEIAHVQACIAEGKKESPLYPLRESLEICEVVDELRGQWGVVYPTD